MEKIKVDFDRLVEALESRAERNFDEFYFDRKSGDILSADRLAQENPVKLRLVEDDSKRFVLIKPLEGQDIGELMEAFLKMIEKCEASEYLESALLNAEFGSFKDILSEYEELEGQWLEFHKRYMEDIASWWLKEHGVSTKFFKNGRLGPSDF